MDAAAEGGRAKVYGTELMDINVDSVQKGIHFFVVMAKYEVVFFRCYVLRVQRVTMIQEWEESYTREMG